MSAAQTKAGKENAREINVNYPDEIQYWAKRLNVTNEQVEAAVLIAGPVVGSVKTYLGVK